MICKQKFGECLKIDHKPLFFNAVVETHKTTIHDASNRLKSQDKLQFLFAYSK